jgi:hypothetical protein
MPISFPIDIHGAEEELGKKGLSELVCLGLWLKNKQRLREGAWGWPRFRVYWQTLLRPKNMLAFRMAPSIAARSEAEMFCISMPRFALRTYFNDGDLAGSFVNARRLGSFCAQAQRWGKRIHSAKTLPGIDETHPKGPPSDLNPDGILRGRLPADDAEVAQGLSRSHR